eukprot:Blabericola_migrator_1__10865@NODE_625_length_7189_cov_131_220444_g456_i0_p3_GENE_NODE_625_length_7189_cov_131_220444_g456_i0NODE_625_length_7189_cov_131_220444_g456_i0_p3_ORF_typecomplete_len347_score43_79Pkinase_Tyr/PF07714_17/3_9e10Pkinase_Tyr/PF07714_17/2_4e14Pkinase/PF00069_25/8_1e22Kinaselike/PF14531_6/5_8e06YHS/PF04945_13/9_2e03YHS/PF04945_13/0_48_NODE_625_length_7189_cov_131_220444_g456_i017722812
MQVEKDNVCEEQSLTLFGFFKHLKNDIPKFHKHENRSMVTAKEAGSSMPLNQATEHEQYDNEEQTLLTLGKSHYPETSKICNHVHHYLEYIVTTADSANSSPSPRNYGHGKLTQPVLLSIARGIILACFYLKQKGIQCLNLKSSNVLVDESFHAKLTDFGQKDLVKAFTHAPLIRPIDAASHHSSAYLNGTGDEAPNRFLVCCPHCRETFDASTIPVVEPTMLRPHRFNWCSPETLRIPLRYHGVNEVSDIYSFGVILWNLLTNQVPFVGLSPTQLRVAVGYAGFKLPPNRVCLPLQRLVSRCLSFIPSDRPSFDYILRTLINIHQSASNSAEDALMAFMQGDWGD